MIFSPPVVILGIQLVGPEAELAGGGTNDLFVQERLEFCLWEAVSPLLMSGTIL